MIQSLGPEAVAQVDRHDMTSMLRSWPRQLARQRADLAKSQWPPRQLEREIQRVFLGGLGGSAIAGDIAYGAAEDDLDLPFRVVRDYHWPGSVNSGSLCLLSSYSGNTEETLSLYDQAKRRGAMLLAVTSGGELARRAQHDGVPIARLPSGLPPRAALGYSLVSVLQLFRSLGWGGADRGELDETQRVLEEGNRLYEPALEDEANPAIQLARAMQGRVMVFYTPARHLSGVGVRWKGQINENAKQIAFQADLPELNHNEIVGWEKLRELHPRFLVVFPRDHEEHPQVARRIELTRQILAEEKVESVEVQPRGESRIARLVSLIQLGDWVSLYLSVLNKIDPVPLAKIDRLKASLEGSV